MTFDELVWVRDNSPTPLRTHTSAEGDEVQFEYGELGSALTIDRHVCIQVEAAHQSFEENAEIEIVDSAGTRIGILCLTAGYELDLSSISNSFYMAYLTEVSRDSYGGPYRMRKSYVLIESSQYDEYAEKYMNSAPLWGGFVHPENAHFLGAGYRSLPNSMVAIEGLSLPSTYHEESSVRSIVQPFPFERYLKLYHLLELRFDYDVVERIRSLGTDLKGIGQIFSDYEHGELKRLRSVVAPGIKDLATLETRLNAVAHCNDCEEVARNIFFRYGKDGNPLKDKETQYELIMAQGGFSIELAKANRLIGGTGTALETAYQKLIVDVSTYWIYRVRSSIAHSRIGEYVMSSSDEEFVVEVAEPLLRQVIVQVFCP